MEGDTDMEAAGGTTTDMHVEEATGPDDSAKEELRSSGSAMEIEGGGLVLNAQKKKKKAAAVRITPAQNQFLREAFEKEGGQAAVTTPMGKCAMITKLSAAFAKVYSAARKDEICTQERFLKLFAPTPTEAELAIQVQKIAARKAQSAHVAAAADAVAATVRAAEESSAPVVRLCEELEGAGYNNPDQVLGLREAQNSLPQFETLRNFVRPTMLDNSLLGSPVLKQTVKRSLILMENMAKKCNEYEWAQDYLDGLQGINHSSEVNAPSPALDILNQNSRARGAQKRPGKTDPYKISSPYKFFHNLVENTIPALFKRMQVVARADAPVETVVTIELASPLTANSLVSPVYGPAGTVGVALAERQVGQLETIFEGQNTSESPDFALFVFKARGRVSTLISGAVDSHLLRLIQAKYGAEPSSCAKGDSRTLKPKYTLHPPVTVDAAVLRAPPTLPAPNAHGTPNNNIAHV